MRLYAAFIALYLFSPLVAHADDDELSRPTLRGLQGVGVLIENLRFEFEQNGLTRSAIQTDVELKLRQAGIPVLSRDMLLQSAGKPYLYVQVSVCIASSDLSCAFHISVELRQNARLERDPNIYSSVSTWSTLGLTGTVEKMNVRMVRDSVKDQVDQFINAYLAMNPKK